MGPNARRKIPPLPEGYIPPTHKDVDKLIARDWRGRPGEAWVIKTMYPDGAPAFWGTMRSGYSGLTPYRANATRYESQNAALHVAYELREHGRIFTFDVVQLPAKPRKAGTDGCGGRALTSIGA